MLGLAGILIALGLLIWLTWRGLSVLVAAPLMATLALLAAGAPVLAAFTQIFMPALGGFIAQYFALFLLGAIFGKLMEATGAAEALAVAIVDRLGEARTVAAVVASCAVLTYGGVSLFVVAFAVQPLAAAMFARAALPTRLIPAAIALGAFTFTMTALPGSPAIQNAIPMPYFGTTAFAAPGLGLVAGAAMAAIGLAWLGWRARRLPHEAPPAGAAPDIRALRERAQGEGYDIAEIGGAAAEERPSAAVAAAPIVAVIGLNYLLSAHLLPMMDTSYLGQPPYGAASFEALRGVWAILAALAGAILLMIALNRRRLPRLGALLSDGANAATGPAFNTASLVGFGAVVAALPAFALIREAAFDIAAGDPLISLALSVNILAGVTGSASGGLSIALSTLGPLYLALGAAEGVAPELLHRVAAIATGGLDALPHNGAVVTLLSVCRATHREAYGDIFVVACLGPLAALALVIALASVFGSF
ncbi:MAG: GntP family permease [Pikeienuella sp.]|uniref:GntP family permease n=1 Tax=Pikeienuella sp. TaxID=2831957 RepID=UPI00391D31D8